jgi:hypothetical protein
VEGRWGTKYVIIDDFVSSGETVKRIVEKMRRNAHGCECVGFYGYHHEEYGTMPPRAIAEKSRRLA